MKLHLLEDKVKVNCIINIDVETANCCYNKIDLKRKLIWDNSTIKQINMSPIKFLGWDKWELGNS